MIYQQRLDRSTQHFELVNGSWDVSSTFEGVGLEDKYTSAMADTPSVYIDRLCFILILC